jgi:hypothetical protein
MQHRPLGQSGIDVSVLALGIPRPAAEALVEQFDQ